MLCFDQRLSVIARRAGCRPAARARALRAGSSRRQSAAPRSRTPRLSRIAASSSQSATAPGRCCREISSRICISPHISAAPSGSPTALPASPSRSPWITKNAADVAGPEADRFQDRDVALLFEHDRRNDVVDAKRGDDQHGADHRVHDDVAGRQRAHQILVGFLPRHALVAEAPLDLGRQPPAR